MGSLSLLQWIFLTQESNCGLLHCSWILYQLRYEGSPQFLLSVSYSSVPKNAQTTAQLYSISRATKVMLKILHARLQHYANQEIQDVHAGFRKGRGTRDQIVNSHWIIEKAREFQKKIYLCFIDYTKAFDCVNHNKLQSS